MCNSQVEATVMNMTEQEYTKKVGSPPIQDDLERVNCPIVGEIGHSSCGWNSCKDIPMFMGSNHADDCKCNLNKGNDENA